MAESEAPHPRMAELLRDAFGAQAAMVLYAAVKLELAERLADGPASAAQLATSLAVDARALERILRALVTQGVCEEVADHRFALTPLGQALRADDPHSIRARVLLNVEVHHSLWASMVNTARNGEPASERVYGLPFYEYLASDREAGSLFDSAMSSPGWALQRFQAAITAYDFGRFDTIVDVGGGNGAFLAEILRSVARPRGIVFDVDRVEAAATKTISTRGLSGRCRFVSGSAFDAVPGGADAYILSNFLNSWGDAQACSLLHSCHRAMKPDATLLLIDWVMPTGGEQPGAAASRDATTMDLVMLCAFGADSGRIRTFSDFCSLLAASGFDVTARVPARGSLEIIEARKSADSRLGSEASH